MARRARYELSILFTALGATAHLFTSRGRDRVPVAALWDLDLSRPVVLEAVSIPLDRAPRLDYARDLRPTCTQALCLHDDGRGAFVMATEYLRPWATEVQGEAPGAILARLPAEFEDPAAGRAWLQRAGAALLARQFERMEAGQ
jgi:hypothetical protein